MIVQESPEILSTHTDKTHGLPPLDRDQNHRPSVVPPRAVPRSGKFVPLSVAEKPVAGSLTHGLYLEQILSKFQHLIVLQIEPFLLYTI